MDSDTVMVLQAGQLVEMGTRSNQPFASICLFSFLACSFLFVILICRWDTLVIFCFAKMHKAVLVGTAVTLLLHCCYCVVTLWLHFCYTIVPLWVGVPSELVSHKDGVFAGMHANMTNAQGA
jgi:hypothetical protein